MLALAVIVVGTMTRRRRRRRGILRFWDQSVGDGGAGLEAQDVFAVFVEARERVGGVERWHAAIWTFEGGAWRAVVVEEFGDGVVEDAVAGAVDGDPVRRDARCLVVVHGAVGGTGRGRV